MNIKTSIIGSTIAAMVAFCGTSQAQSIFNVSGWGIGGYGNGGDWAITEGSPGNFSIGGSTLTGGASWVAAFPGPVNINNAGDYVELTGQFTVTGGFGGTGPFRFGLYDDLGNIGGTAWTGYTVAPATYGAAPGGNGEFGGHVASSWASTFSGYGFGASSGNTNGIANDTYSLDLKLSRLGATLMRVDLALDGQVYQENVFAIDSGGAATANSTYNAVGFYLSNAGTSATQIDFQNVQITYVPEPASMALLGGGLLSLMMVRRFRK